MGGIAASGASPAVAALVESVLHALRVASWKAIGLLLKRFFNSFKLTSEGSSEVTEKKPPEAPKP